MAGRERAKEPDDGRRAGLVESVQQLDRSTRLDDARERIRVTVGDEPVQQHLADVAIDGFEQRLEDRQCIGAEPEDDTGEHGDRLCPACAGHACASTAHAFECREHRGEHACAEATQQGREPLVIGTGCDGTAKHRLDGTVAELDELRFRLQLAGSHAVAQPLHVGVVRLDRVRGPRRRVELAEEPGGARLRGDPGREDDRILRRLAAAGRGNAERQTMHRGGLAGDASRQRGETTSLVGSTVAKRRDDRGLRPFDGDRTGSVALRSAWRLACALDGSTCGTLGPAACARGACEHLQRSRIGGAQLHGALRRFHRIRLATGLDQGPGEAELVGERPLAEAGAQLHVCAVGFRSAPELTERQCMGQPRGGVARIRSEDAGEAARGRAGVAGEQQLDAEQVISHGGTATRLLRPPGEARHDEPAESTGDEQEHELNEGRLRGDPFEPARVRGLHERDHVDSKRNGSSERNSPTRSPIWRTASSTPFMNARRSLVSCRIVSSSPGPPNSTS